MNQIVVDRVPQRIPPRPTARHAEPIAPAVPTYRPYPLRPLLVAGLLTLLAWGGVFVLFFSHTLWGAPSLVPDRWPAVFYPFERLLPSGWVHAPLNSPIGWANAALWVALVAGLFAAWGWALRVAVRLPAGDRRLERAGGRIVIAGLVLFSALLVFSPAIASQDLFSTIFYAKIAGVYGGNPYIQPPSFFAAQDSAHWLQWIFWKNQPCVYGPAWVIPAALLAQVAQALDGDIVTHLLTQRIGTAVVNIANAALIWHLAGRLFPGKPGARLAATLFYAWCPLVVWEFANNGHNDALLVFWVLVAIWCHLQGTDAAGAGRTEVRTTNGEPRVAAWWLAAVAALTLAGLTKATGFLLIPAYLVLLYHAVNQGPQPWRRRALLTLGAGGVVLGLSALLYLPYWAGPATLDAIIHAPGNERYANSVGVIFRFWLPQVIETAGGALGQTGSAWSAEQIGAGIEPWVRLLLLGSAGLIGLLLTLRVRDLPSLLRHGGWLLAAYVLLGASWAWPWYLTWIIPLAALAGPGRLRQTMVLTTAAGMIFYIQ